MEGPTLVYVLSKKKFKSEKIRCIRKEFALIFSINIHDDLNVFFHNEKHLLLH